MFYLQEFLYAVCEHPTLRVSPAFHAFVSLKDDSHFEKYKKEFDKVSNPNAVIATSGINKKLFYLKNPIKIDHMINPSGVADCRINGPLKNYSNTIGSKFKDLIPAVHK